MIFAFINDNMVKEIQETTLEEAQMRAQYFQQIVDISLLSPQPKVGWLWDGTKIYRNIPSVTPRQIRQALILSGISIAQIESALDSLPEPIKSLAKTEWEYSNAFERNRPLVEQMGAMLGWSSEQLDNLWLFAGSLK